MRFALTMHQAPRCFGGLMIPRRGSPQRVVGSHQGRGVRRVALRQDQMGAHQRHDVARGHSLLACDRSSRAPRCGACRRRSNKFNAQLHET